jgi:hypothetical protein
MWIDVTKTCVWKLRGNIQPAGYQCRKISPLRVGTAVEDVLRTRRGPRFKRTRQIPSPSNALVESICRTETARLRNFIILLSLPLNTRKTRTWSCRRAVTDSAESQPSSFRANGCSTSLIPVWFWYSVTADWRSDVKTADSVRVLILYQKYCG